jgi:hypothetical protein
MGAVLALLHSRVVKGRPAPFIEMLGPAMGIVAFGRVQTPAVEREIERGDELARRIAAGDPAAAPPARPRRPGTSARYASSRFSRRSASRRSGSSGSISREFPCPSSSPESGGGSKIAQLTNWSPSRER